MAQRIILYLTTLFLITLYDVFATDSVLTNVQMIKRRPNGLAEELRVTINVQSQLVSLNLRLVHHMTPNIPVHSVSNLDNEESRVKQENVSHSQNVGCYQDVENGAAMMVTEVKNAESVESTYILKGNFLYEGEQYSIQTVQEGQQLETTGQNSRYVIEKVPLRRFTGTDYVRPDAAAEKSAPPKRSAKLRRAKRDSTHRVIVDVIAVADHSLFRQAMRHSNHSREDAIKFLQQHFALIFNGVDLIYQKINSSKIEIRVKLVKIIIIENYKDFKIHHLSKLDQSVDSDAALNTLKQFVMATNLTEQSDHVMLFLGSDLFWRSVFYYLKIDLLGVARLSSLCSTIGDSISVVEDMPRYEFEVITTAAHELAHSMSVDHDGTDNNCTDNEHYIMATSPSANGTKLNPWHFSECSVRSFTDFIITKRQTDHGLMCLTGSFPVNPDIPDVSDKYFGQVIPPKEQCRQTYGKGSYHCKKVGYDLTEMCTAMYCYDPARLDCFPQKALAGTQCGQDKVCRLGQCEVMENGTTIATVSTTQ